MAQVVPIPRWNGWNYSFKYTTAEMQQLIKWAQYYGAQYVFDRLQEDYDALKPQIEQSRKILLERYGSCPEEEPEPIEGGEDAR